MIARYTRPEIGAVWTDEARFGAMRDVEVAAAEALDGPTAGGARRDPRGDLHGRRDQRAREDPRPRHGGVRRRAGGVGGPGGALDPLRADVLRRRRHRARAAAPAGGRAARSGGAHAGLGAGREGPRARRARCASAAPTASTPSRRRSGSSSRATRWRRTATPSAWSARSAQITAAISGAVGTFATLGPDYEARVMAKLGLTPRRSRPRSSRATATPSC